MRCSVIGAGYVGLVQAVGLALAGHETVCVDIDEARVRLLEHGRCPIVEDGLEDAIVRAQAAGTLRFTTNAGAIVDSEVCFVAVGTPTDAVTGNANLAYLWSAAEGVASHLPPGAAVVVKSTVPIGTCERLQARLDRLAPGQGLEVVSNPEFLREGSALADFDNPERIILGGRSRPALDRVRRVYARFDDAGVPFVLTDWHSSETIKYAANSFLAMKVSFINEIANLTEAVGGDVEAVALGIGLDARIGRQFLRAGPGYGGSCFPKDTLALAVTARQYGVRQQILEAVISANDARRFDMLHRIRQLAGRELHDARIGVLGLAFKARTDDVRDSPAVGVVHSLLGQGATVRAYDPVASYDAGMDGYVQSPTIEDAARGADVMVVLTEWPEFAAYDYTALDDVVRQRHIYDTRRVTEPGSPRTLGWHVARIGDRMAATGGGDGTGRDAANGGTT